MRETIGGRQCFEAFRHILQNQISYQELGSEGKLTTPCHFGGRQVHGKEGANKTYRELGEGIF
jgi:hypothetical protein